MALLELVGWLEAHKRSLDTVHSRYSRPSIESTARNFGPWAADEQLHASASNLRMAAQLVHHETTKLSLVFTATSDEAAVTSIVEEYKEALEKLMAHYLVLCSQAAGSAMIASATSKTRGVVYAVLRLFQLLVDGATAKLPSGTGVVWKMCEDLGKLPLSNKVAYRRAMLEHLTASNDTNAEFAQYLNASESKDNAGAGDDEEDDFEGDADCYSHEELPFALVAIDALKLCTGTLTATLEIVSDVANRAATTGAPHDEQTVIQKWTEECHLLAAQVETLLTDLGAELYPPMDIESAGEQLPPVLDVVRRLCRTLLGDSVQTEEEKSEQKSSDAQHAILQELLSSTQFAAVNQCLSAAEDVAQRFEALESST